MTLYRRNLAPGEVEHWWGHFEAADGEVEDQKLLTDGDAFEWARARSKHIYVNVPHEAEPARYWAGEGPPPTPDLLPWTGRTADQPAPTLLEKKRARWEAEHRQP